MTLRPPAQQPLCFLRPVYGSLGRAHTRPLPARNVAMHSITSLCSAAFASVGRSRAGMTTPMSETSASVGKGPSVSNVAWKGGARSSKNQFRAPPIPCPWVCGLEASRFGGGGVGPMGARKGSGLRDRLFIPVSRNGYPRCTKTWIERTRELDGRACEGRRSRVRPTGPSIQGQ